MFIRTHSFDVYLPVFSEQTLEENASRRPDREFRKKAHELLYTDRGERRTNSKIRRTSFPVKAMKQMLPRSFLKTQKLRISSQVCAESHFDQNQRPKASKSDLGKIFGPLGRSWGALERSWSLLRRSGGILEILGPLRANLVRLGSILGGSWEDLKRSGAVLELSCAPTGRITRFSGSCQERCPLG